MAQLMGDQERVEWSRSRHREIDNNYASALCRGHGLRIRAEICRSRAGGKYTEAAPAPEASRIPCIVDEAVNVDCDRSQNWGAEAGCDISPGGSAIIEYLTPLAVVDLRVDDVAKHPWPATGWGVRVVDDREICAGENRRCYRTAEGEVGSRRPYLVRRTLVAAPEHAIGIGFTESARICDCGRSLYGTPAKRHLNEFIAHRASRPGSIRPGDERHDKDARDRRQQSRPRAAPRASSLRQHVCGASEDTERA